MLGAAMFMVEIRGMRCLYTGDYSRVPDRHMPAADIPSIPPHIIIVESTFGTSNHLPREDRERRFQSKVPPRPSPPAHAALSSAAVAPQRMHSAMSPGCILTGISGGGLARCLYTSPHGGVLWRSTACAACRCNRRRHRSHTCLHRAALRVAKASATGA